MGLGLQGNRLRRAIGSSRKNQLVARASQRQPGSFDRALKNPQVDAVAIATTNETHARFAQAAARAHKHILCEKPLARTTREAQGIRETVKKSRVRFFVDYHLRMHKDAQRIRKLIQQKKLGAITHIELCWCIGDLAQKSPPPLPKHMRWREDEMRAGTGSFMIRGVHLVDLLRFTTGEEIKEIYGWSASRGTHIGKTSLAICVLHSGVTATLLTSKAMPSADNRVTIYGTKGSVTVRRLFRDNPHRMYIQVFDEFADALRGKKTLLATLEDGAAVVAATEAFTRSTRSGKKVRV